MMINAYPFEQSDSGLFLVDVSTRASTGTGTSAGASTGNCSGPCPEETYIMGQSCQVECPRPRSGESSAAATDAAAAACTTDGTAPPGSRACTSTGACTQQRI